MTRYLLLTFDATGRSEDTCSAAKSDAGGMNTMVQGRVAASAEIIGREIRLAA